MQKYSNCFLGVKKGCKSRNCLIYTLYCGERGIRKAKPSRGHISKNNPYLATQPPLRENPLEKAAAGIAAFCCGTERPSCCSDDLLETKKRQTSVCRCGRFRLAEREGFEPPVQLPVHRISSAARSTTPASLQYVRTLSVHLPFGLRVCRSPQPDSLKDNQQGSRLNGVQR